METMIDTTPRIYVASLADYNAGRLYGAWIDATQDAADIQEEVNAMLARSSEPIAEEWAIHDTDNFEGIKIDEYESFERVSEIANLVMEHGAAWSAFCQLVGEDYATAEDFEEAYQGEYESEEAFAESTVDEGLWGEVPEHLAAYIDYEKIARDLFMGDYSSVDTSSGCYVFRSI